MSTDTERAMSEREQFGAAFERATGFKPLWREHLQKYVGHAEPFYELWQAARAPVVPAQGWSDKQMLEFGSFCVLKRRKRITVKEALDEYAATQAAPSRPEKGE